MPIAPLLAAWGPAANGCVLANLDLDGAASDTDLRALLDN